MEAVAIHAVGLTPAVLERVERGFAEEREEFSVTASEDPETALEAIADEPADCVVCTPDVREPGLLGFRALARERGIEAPFVLFDGQHAAVLAGSNVGVGPGGRDGGSLAADETEDPVSSLVECVDAAVAASTSPDRSAMGSLAIAPDRLQPFLEALADPVFVIDGDRRFVAVNDAMVEYVGIDRETIERAPVEEIVRQESIDASEEKLAALREGSITQTTLELSFQTDGGEDRVAEANVSVRTDEDGDYDGSVGMLRDVTNRIERERELALYESILETTPIGIFAADEDGTIIWCNEAYPEPYHFTREDLMGAHFTRIVEAGYYDGTNLEDYLERVRHLLSSENDDERVTYEDTIVDNEGNTRIYEVTMGLLPLDDGEFAGTVQAFREVTEERRYQRELERQNQRLDNFASFVSHDLRNPLNVAQGYLDLIAQDADDERIEELAWSLDRMEELIGDLLTLAREGKEIGETDPVSLEAIARESWDAVDTPGATLVLDGDVTIDADPDRLRSLFENLFRNSIEHGIDADAGSETTAADEALLTVTVGPLDASDSRSGSPEAPAETTGFYVADDGTGLPTDDGEIDQSLFEIGYTTNESGTGFGMGIVKEIADAHGWSITAGESEVGGALFEVRGVRPAHALPKDDAADE